MARALSNVVGFDDAPFSRGHRGDVPIVGAVFARVRLDGVLIGSVRRDGADSTRKIARLLAESRFVDHVQAVLLQGIAFAGFNVVDIHALSADLELPVVVVARRQPDFSAIQRALASRVPGGRRKWALIEQAGPMEQLGGVYAQRAGVDRQQAMRLLRELTVYGNLPEPLRVAHLIAGALATGQSHGGA